MRAVVQRVTSARVTVAGRTVGRIGRGLLVLLAVGREDGPQDAAYLAGKIRDLRIFDDPAGAGGRRRMHVSVGDAGGQVLVVSQFTLYGDCRRGRRPSFDAAAPPDAARGLYEASVDALRAAGLDVATGAFQDDMAVELVNDGPVTILLDSRRLF